MSVFVHAVMPSNVPPIKMSDRFRHEITYFMSLPGSPGAPPLADGQYWVRLDDARRWLDEGVFYLVSPLDSANQTEIELSEEQEAWLEWLVRHGVEQLELRNAG